MQKAKGKGKDLTRLGRKYEKYRTKYENLNEKAVETPGVTAQQLLL